MQDEKRRVYPPNRFSPELTESAIFASLIYSLRPKDLTGGKYQHAFFSSIEPIYTFVSYLFIPVHIIIFYSLLQRYFNI